MCFSRVFPQGDLVDSRQISSRVIKVFCLEKIPASRTESCKICHFAVFLSIR